MPFFILNFCDVLFPLFTLCWHKYPRHSFYVVRCIICDRIFSSCSQYLPRICMSNKMLFDFYVYYCSCSLVIYLPWCSFLVNHKCWSGDGWRENKSGIVDACRFRFQYVHKFWLLLLLLLMLAVTVPPSEWKTLKIKSDTNDYVWNVFSFRKPFQCEIHWI